MEVKKVRVDLIDPNPLQVRQKIDEEKISELTKSIKEVDIVNLPIVQKKGNRYQLIAGERRWRAAKKAGVTEILCMIREGISDFESLLISGAENIHREDLTSIERENLIYELWKIGLESAKIKDKGHLAEKLGLHQSTIHNVIRVKEFRDKHNLGPKVSTAAIWDTIGLSDEERIKLLTRHEKGEVGAREIREYTRAIKEASQPVKEVLLEVGSPVTLEEAITVESKLETVEEKERAIGILRREKERGLEFVLEIAKERPRVPMMLDEIDTGFLWKCPICGQEYHLIHIAGEKGQVDHKFEEVVK